MSFLESKILKLDNGMEVLKVEDSVNFLILTKDNYVILGEQPRAGVMGAEVLNLLGGYLKEGEGHIEAALREMEEETNISVEFVETVHTVYVNKYPDIGKTTEKNSLVIIKIKKDFNELELKSNDEKEKVKPKGYMLENYESLILLQSTLLGLKAMVAIEYLKNTIGKGIKL